MASGIHSNSLTFIRCDRWKRNWSRPTTSYADTATVSRERTLWNPESDDQVPVDLTNMVRHLQRTLDAEYAINVKIKHSVIHNSSYVVGTVQEFPALTWETNKWLTFFDFRRRRTLNPIVTHYPSETNSLWLRLLNIFQSLKPKKKILTA